MDGNDKKSREDVTVIISCDGETLSADNLAVKRPNSGRSPFEYWDLIGRKAVHSYAPDDPVDG